MPLVARLLHALLHLSLVTRPLPITQSRCLRYSSLLLTNYRCDMLPCHAHAPMSVPRIDTNRIAAREFLTVAGQVVVRCACMCDMQCTRGRPKNDTQQLHCAVLSYSSCRQELWVAKVHVPWRPFWEEMQSLMRLCKQPSLAGGWHAAFESLHTVICQVWATRAVCSAQCWRFLHPQCNTSVAQLSRFVPSL